MIDLKNEIDILEEVSRILIKADIPFMLTGSMAMNFYAQPRMTRDIDVILSIEKGKEDLIISKLEWANKSRSELQINDIRNLFYESSKWMTLTLS